MKKRKRKNKNISKTVAMLPIILLVAVIAVIAVIQSQKLDADTDTVLVKENQTIQAVNVSELNHAYYDEAELKRFIKNAVADYVKKNGTDSVKISRLKFKDNKAKLYLNYKNYEAYAGFNGVEFFTGNMVQAQAQGYVFPEKMLAVTNGNTESAVDTDQLTRQDDLQVIVLGQNTDVKVRGDILYISDGQVKLSSRNTATVTCDSGNGNQTLAYIVYK